VVAALILDQWGLMGNPRSAASPLRLLGAAMLIGGVLVITRAKALEQREGVRESAARAAALEEAPVPGDPPDPAS